MRPTIHLVSSGVVALGAYALTRSVPLSAAILIAGTLIDLDHVPEFIREHGLRLDPRYFLGTFRGTRYQRLYLVLHSWELLTLTAVAAWLSGWNPWITGALLGAGLHLTLDQVGNYVRPGGYFLVLRWRHGFRVGGLKSGVGFESDDTKNGPRNPSVPLLAGLRSGTRNNTKVGLD